QVQLQRPPTLNDAEEHALMVDDIRFAPGPRNTERNNDRNNDARPPRPPRPGNDTTARTDINNVQLKKLTPAEREQLKAAGKCFKCRKAGPMAKDCTTPRPGNPRGNLPPRPSRTNLNNVSTSTESTPPENPQRQ